MSSFAICRHPAMESLEGDKKFRTILIDQLKMFINSTHTNYMEDSFKLRRPAVQNGILHTVYINKIIMYWIQRSTTYLCPFKKEAKDSKGTVRKWLIWGALYQILSAKRNWKFFCQIELEMIHIFFFGSFKIYTWI